MAAGDTQITIAGNLVDDPELRYTPTGQAVAKFRVASTPGSVTTPAASGRTATVSSSPATSGARRPRTWPRACSGACG
jgi:single-stranded DNA-binding protein